MTEFISGYDRRIKITLDISEDITKFIIPVKITNSNFLGTVESADYNKVAFTDYLNNKIYAILETFESGYAVYHVVTDITAENNYIYLYYDTTDDEANSYISNSLLSVTNMDFLHLFNSVPTSSLPDRSGNNHPLTPTGTFASGDLIDFQFGKAIQLNGTDNGFLMSGTSLQWLGDFTFEFFMKTSNGAASEALMYKYQDSNDIFFRSSSGTLQLVLSGATLNSDNAINDDSVHYIVIRKTSGLFELIIDNIVNDSVSSSAIFSNAATPTIGRSPWGAPYADQQFALIRAFQEAKSDEWLNAAYAAFNDTLLTFGSIEVYVEPVSVEKYSLYKFKLVLLGNPGTRNNWVSLFDNTVYSGSASDAAAEWTNSRWEIEVGSKFTNPATLTVIGDDFDTFRPTKLNIFFTNADTLDVKLYHSNGENYETTGYVSGSDLFVFWDLYSITKIEFYRSDVFELYPYITDIQFYDADYVPTVIDDLILPCSSCSITYQLNMKDSEGNDMPIWDSTANPGDNGYSLAQSKYAINFSNATVPGEDYVSDILARLNNDLTLYISTLTTNNEPDWQELVSGTLENAIPDTGALSLSVRLSGKKEIALSDVTWDYQETMINKITYLSPNQSDGKYTWQCPGIIPALKPGFKAIYGSSEILISEIQYNISASGIQMYLKE